MPINPIYCTQLGIPVTRSTTNNVEAYKGEKETLINLYKSYLAPYKNTPKGAYVTTAFDIDPSARTFILQLEKRLTDLGVLPDIKGTNIKY